jgi:hypothetical protein
MADNQINLVLSAMAREGTGTVAFVADATRPRRRPRSKKPGSGTRCGRR